MIEQIKIAETKINRKQLKTAKADAEKIFGRKLTNLENLLKPDF